MRVVTAIAIMVLITGCAAVSSAHRDGGSIQHGAAVSDERLKKMADEECAAFGKTAQLRETDYVTLEGTRTRYDCAD